MTREQWNELAARCESAKGPDREIDDAIWWPCVVKTGPYRVSPLGVREFDRFNGLNEKPDWHPVGERYDIPRYTDSLDAITSLIERELPDEHWRVQGGNPNTGRVQMSGPPPEFSE